MSKKHQGLTLVELLGAVVVLGILSTILFLVASTMIRVLNQIYDENSLTSQGLVMTSSIFGELNRFNPDRVEQSCSERSCTMTFSEAGEQLVLAYEKTGDLYTLWWVKGGNRIDLDYPFSTIEFLPMIEHDQTQLISIRVTLTQRDKSYDFLFSYMIYRYDD